MKTNSLNYLNRLIALVVFFLICERSLGEMQKPMWLSSEVRAIMVVNSVKGQREDSGYRLKVDVTVEESWGKSLEKGMTLHWDYIINTAQMRVYRDPWIRLKPVEGQRYLLYSDLDKESLSSPAGGAINGKLLLDKTLEKDAKFIVDIDARHDNIKRSDRLLEYLDANQNDELSYLLWGYAEYVMKNGGGEVSRSLFSAFLKKQIGPYELEAGSSFVRDSFHSRGENPSMRILGVKLAVKYVIDQKDNVDPAAFLRDTSWIKKFPGKADLSDGDEKFFLEWKSEFSGKSGNHDVDTRISELLKQVGID